MSTGLAEDYGEDVVVVHANRIAQIKEEVSSSLTVLTEEDFQQNQPQSLVEILRGEPNISFSGGPRITGQQLEVRGQGGNAVTVRIDDARQNFVSGHAGQRFFVDPFFLKRGEIIRGTKSHLYGSGPAGVVNLTTYEPSDLLSGDRQQGGLLKTGYQGVNAEKSVASFFATRHESWEILLGYAQRQADDLSLGTGEKLAGSGIERRSALLKLSSTFHDDHSLKLGYQYYQSEDQNGANPQQDAGRSNPLVDREIQFQQAHLKYQWDPHYSELINASLHLYANQTEQTRRYRAPTGRNFNRSNTHTLFSAGGELTNHSRYQALGAAHDLLAGLSFHYDQQEGRESRDDFFSGGAVGTSSGRPDAEAKSTALFFENTSSWDNGLQWSLGGRLDLFSTSGRLFDRREGQFSPHIGLRYEFREGHTVFADYSRGFNHPTLNEIYQDGSHFGVVPTAFFPAPAYFEELFVGNEDLTAEQSETIELGMDSKGSFLGGEYTAKAVYFIQKGEDTIDSRIVGRPTIVPNFPGAVGPGTLTRVARQSFNRGQTTIQGVELEVAYQRGGLDTRMTYSSLTGKDDDTGEKLNLTPGDKWYGEVGYTFQNELRISANAALVGSRASKVSDDSLKTGAYDLYGLSAQWMPRDFLTLTVGVHNLFNEVYQISNRNNTQAGRNLYVSASYQF